VKLGEGRPRSRSPNSIYSIDLVLDVRRLEILLAVRRSRSISRAARSVHLSASAVSQHMSALEREIGIQLLVRTPGQEVRLTDAGLRLSAHAEEVVSRLARAEAEMNVLAERAVAKVRVGAFATASAALMPPAIARFRRANPEVELDVRIMDPVDGVAALRNGEVDVAVLTEVPDRGPEFEGVDTVPLLDDHFSVLLPAGHRFADQSEVPLSALAAEPWIVSSATGTCPDARIFQAGCAAAGFTPQVAFSSEDYSAIQGLVAASVGVALIPELAVRQLRGDVAVTPLSSPVLFRRVAVATLPGEGTDDGPVARFVSTLTGMLGPTRTPVG
jgi:DNA-binding transcriptional LysR family regulator